MTEYLGLDSYCQIIKISVKYTESDVLRVTGILPNIITIIIYYHFIIYNYMLLLLIIIVSVVRLLFLIK